MCKITGRIYLILKVTAFPIETSAKCLLLSSSNISPIWFSLDIGLHLYLFYVGNFRIHFNVFSSICYCVFAFVSFLSARILLVFLFCYFYYVSVSILFLFLFCYLLFYFYFVICICICYLYFVICISLFVFGISILFVFLFLCCASTPVWHHSWANAPTGLVRQLRLQFIPFSVQIVTSCLNPPSADCKCG